MTDNLRFQRNVREMRAVKAILIAAILALPSVADVVAAAKSVCYR